MAHWLSLLRPQFVIESFDSLTGFQQFDLRPDCFSTCVMFLCSISWWKYCTMIVWHQYALSSALQPSWGYSSVLWVGILWIISMSDARCGYHRILRAVHPISMSQYHMCKAVKEDSLVLLHCWKENHSVFLLYFVLIITLACMKLYAQNMYHALSQLPTLCIIWDTCSMNISISWD